MLKLKYTGELTVLSHIVEEPRPMARAIASFDGIDDVFYSALDGWSQADYLRQWSHALQRIARRNPVVVVVKSVHPPQIAGHCEAYVGWLRGSGYVFQDMAVNLPPSFERSRGSDWHELVGAYSAVSADGDPIRAQWSVSPDDA